MRGKQVSVYREPAHEPFLETLTPNTSSTLPQKCTLPLTVSYDIVLEPQQPFQEKNKKLRGSEPP
jgi:hypothetical protein